MLLTASVGQTDGLALLLLPIYVIPYFTLSAFTTRFLDVKNGVLRVLLVLVAGVATTLSLLMTYSYTSSQRESSLGGTIYTVPATARLLGILALLAYIAGQAWLWNIYLRTHRK